MKLKDSTTITLIPLLPKQVYENQIKFKRESEACERENTSEKHSERRQLDSTTDEININLAKSGTMTRGAKKVRVRKEESMEKTKK